MHRIKLILYAIMVLAIILAVSWGGVGLEAHFRPEGGKWDIILGAPS